MLDIEKLIESCGKGDKSAIKELYEQFSPKLFGVCMSYCKNRMEAEDFLHEGFLKIIENIEKFQHKGSFEGWMRRVMVNTILESYRKIKRMPMVDEDQLPANLTDEDYEEEDVGQLPDIGDIVKLVDEMPTRYRFVFNLFVLEGLTHEEIGRELQISTGTSKSNLARARKWLKRRLTKEAMEK